jgi:phage baseplate assembly protein gpV
MFENTTFEAGRESTVQKYYGKYPALVLENTVPEDEDDYGGHRGELKVEIPGILEEDPDTEDAQRALQVRAKPCMHTGFFVIPENQSQVWVEFVEGDINTPVWTGVWYPRDAAPPTTDDEAPTEFQKIIRTASGHVIQLDDTDDEQKVVIKHMQGSLINIDKDGHITIEHKDGFKIELKADKTVEINCDKVRINADVTIDGNLDVTGDVAVGQGPKTTISGNEITGG